jgi:hypothetical protein
MNSKRLPSSNDSFIVRDIGEITYRGGLMSTTGIEAPLPIGKRKDTLLNEVSALKSEKEAEAWREDNLGYLQALGRDALDIVDVAFYIKFDEIKAAE